MERQRADRGVVGNRGRVVAVELNRHLSRRVDDEGRVRLRKAEVRAPPVHDLLGFRDVEADVFEFHRCRNGCVEMVVKKGLKETP